MGSTDKKAVKFAEIPILSPMGILVVENEALKMEIEDLERHVATRDAKLVEARGTINNLKNDCRRVKVYQSALYEIHGALEDAGISQEDYE